MKSIFFLAAAGLVVAQNLAGEPACATPCLLTAISSVCGAQATDQGCACASSSAIGNAAVLCLLGNCNSTELIQAQSAGAAQCVSYSATANSGSGTPAPSTTAPTTSATGSATNTSTTDTITSSASLHTTSSSHSSSASKSGSSSASGSAASASSTAGAAIMQGPAIVGTGLVGLLLAGAAAL